MNNPIWIMTSAFPRLTFKQVAAKAKEVGAQGMELVGVPNQMYLIIQTVIIFFMAAQAGFLDLLHARLQKRRSRSKSGKGAASHV